MGKSIEQLKQELDKAKKDIEEKENEFRNRIAEDEHDRFFGKYFTSIQSLDFTYVHVKKGSRTWDGPPFMGTSIRMYQVGTEIHYEYNPMTVIDLLWLKQQAKEISKEVFIDALNTFKNKIKP